MSPALASGLQIALVLAALALVHVPLGDYLARMYTSPKDTRVERGFYRLLRVEARADQRWSTYLLSVLAFSVVSILLLWGLLSINRVLPFAFGTPSMPAAQGFNTAVSFVTNTNWQSYSGESALGYTVQAIGLTVQNFLSAGVGMVVVVALIRGLTRRGTDRLGNFWVDLTRTAFRLLLPLSFLAAIVLVATGVIQNLNAPAELVTAAGGTQTLPGGLVASQEAIKELGTNGGGYFNANSAHPFENPNAVTNLFEIFLLLVIPFSLPRTFGRMVGSVKQGFAILAVMAVLYLGSLGAVLLAENAHPGVALQAAGAAMEGKETRFGIPLSAMFAVSTTLTSTGAVDSMHSSYTGLGGGALLLNMLLGEIAPGGTGSGLYGMLDPGHRHGVHRRPDGRPHADLSGQADRRRADALGRRIPAGDPGAGAAGYRSWRCWCPRPGRRCSTAVHMPCPRSSTPSGRRRTTTARHSPDWAPTPTSTTSHWGSACCWAGSCRSRSCSAWPGRWAGRRPSPRTPGRYPPIGRSSY